MLAYRVFDSFERFRGFDGFPERESRLACGHAGGLDVARRAFATTAYATGVEGPNHDRCGRLAPPVNVTGTPLRPAEMTLVSVARSHL